MNYCYSLVALAGNIQLCAVVYLHSSIFVTSTLIKKWKTGQENKKTGQGFREDEARTKLNNLGSSSRVTLPGSGVVCTPGWLAASNWKTTTFLVFVILLITLSVSTSPGRKDDILPLSYRKMILYWPSRKEDHLFASGSASTSGRHSQGPLEVTEKAFSLRCLACAFFSRDHICIFLASMDSN